MKITVEYYPGPAEMADEFAEWGSDEQAAFLNSVARLFETWGRHGAESQALQIAGNLTPQARRLIADVDFFARGVPSPGADATDVSAKEYGP